MIELRDFSIGYDSRTLLEDVNCCFVPGTLTALLGRNGTGKSTLLRAIAGLGSYGGTVSIDGVDLTTIDAKHAARLLAFVSTERARVRAFKCRDIVGLGRAPYTGWTGSLSVEDKKIVNNALLAVGMQDYANRTADTMSDGEWQRVMIARALAQDTPVMLLDEPTSFLDLPNRYELCTLLADLAHEHRKCIVFSTHELDIAIALSDHIALIDTPQLLCESTPEILKYKHISRLFDPESRIPTELWNLRR